MDDDLELLDEPKDSWVDKKLVYVDYYDLENGYALPFMSHESL